MSTTKVLEEEIKEIRKIPLQRLRIYRWLQQEHIQHSLFWVGIFLVVFSFFAIHAWYQNMITGVEIQSPFWIEFFIQSNNLPRFQSFLHVFIESLVYTIIIAIPVYVNFFALYKNNNVFSFIRNRMRKGEQEGWGLILFIIGSGIIAFLFAFPIYFFFHEYLVIIESRHWSHTFVVILLLTIVTAALSNNNAEMERIRDLERLERLKVIEDRKRAEEKLNFLKKQIRPHFLFNTLQNLQILAKKKSDDLPQLMLQLSTLLRYLIYRTDAEKVSLLDELDFIESYIDLKSFQKSPSTVVSFTKKGEFTPHLKIAPMVLLNIIENCFKHASSTADGQEFIHINLNVQGHYLDLETRNTFQNNIQNEAYMNEFKDGGVGLQSTKEILKMVYKESFLWNQFAEDNVYVSQLRLPLM